MVTAYVSLQSVVLAKLTNGFLGRKKKLILTSSAETLKEEKAIVILPADITYVSQEAATSKKQLRGLFKRYLEELKIEEDQAICFSTKLNATDNSERHLLIIIDREKLTQILQKAKQINLKIEGFLPEPVVLQKLLANEIAGDEKRLILNIGEGESRIYLLDRFGPVRVLSKTISTSKLIPETQKLLKESPEIEKVCSLGIYFGERSLAFDEKVFKEHTGIKLISADKILSVRLNKSEITLYRKEFEKSNSLLVPRGVQKPSSRTKLGTGQGCVSSETNNLVTGEVLNRFVLVASAAILFNKKEIVKLDEIDLSFEEEKPIIAKSAVQPFVVKEKRFPSSRLLLISFGAAFIVAGLVLGVLRLRRSGLLSSHGETPTTVPTQILLSPTPTLTPTPTVNPKDVKVRVLNGGGVKGAAAKIATFLEDKSFKIVNTGNAPSFNFGKTEVRYKNGASDKADLVIESLEEEISVATEQASLSSGDKVDVEIIVGKE